MKTFLILLIRAYQFLLSPWLGNQCRFYPTCSAYAIEAIQRHGGAKGSWLATKRLARCQPWCEGGFDPVPGTEQCHQASATSNKCIHEQLRQNKDMPPNHNDGNKS